MHFSVRVHECRLLNLCYIAWLAGEGEPDTPQSFDVWVAFEFPSFASYSTPSSKMNIKPGRYVVLEPNTECALGIRDQDATDGAPVMAYSDSLIEAQKV